MIIIILETTNYKSGLNPRSKRSPAEVNGISISNDVHYYMVCLHAHIHSIPTIYTYTYFDDIK